MKRKNVNGGSGEGTWCTPLWIAQLLGLFDIDPCSNPRSHVEAVSRLTLEDGDNGLLIDEGPGHYLHAGIIFLAHVSLRPFINPPYNRGEVIKWVRHWRHTRFTFLLKWDPSTKWFWELIGHCTHVWFPMVRRIAFEPPPGVEASANPFPHALYLREPPEDLVARLRSQGCLLEVDQSVLDILSREYQAVRNEIRQSKGTGRRREGDRRKGRARGSKDGARGRRARIPGDDELYGGVGSEAA